MRRAFFIAAALALAACGPASPKDPDASAAGKAFLATNARAAGVVVTASGLQYQVLHAGPPAGLKPKLADEVKVDYEGALLDGEVFDSSYQRGEPVVMTLRDLVPGWQEALQMMRPGDEWRIWLPAKLGYGDKGAGPIPPGSVLVFKLHLIDVLPDQSSIGRG